MMNGLFRDPSATRWVIPAVAILFLVASDRVVAQDDFEAAPTLQAGAILGEKAAGAHYRVAQDVANDGYMNFYRIESDFGPFEAYG
ncbi:MAG: hypothetical protein OES47_13180, partial [Acidobacteriota bacterium]|nr:hypothetical protein [Acidobacteriota bacterium]